MSAFQKITIDYDGRIKKEDRLKSFLLSSVGMLPGIEKLSYAALFGSRYLHFRRFLNRSQFFSAHTIEEYQYARLRAIVQHAYSNVPYYRKLFNSLNLSPSDMTTTRDLAALPILDKHAIRENKESFLANGYQKYRSKTNFTGGTTGEPLAFELDYETINLGRALLHRWYDWIGLRSDYAIARLGIPFGQREGKLDLETMARYDPIVKLLEINTVKISSHHLKCIVALLQRYRPEVIQGYPDLLSILAYYIRDHVNDFYQPKLIRCGAEMLYDHQRELFKQVFGCSVFNFYGSEEHACSAYECRAGNLHMSPEMSIVEIVKDGRVCKSGEIGELICTQLHNYTMPLLRYRIHDYGSIQEGNCPCGVSLPILKIAGARDKDIIITKKGPYFADYTLLHSVLVQFKVKSLQFYQENKNEITLKLVKDNGYSYEQEGILKSRLIEYFDHSAEIVIRHVDDIPRSANGKYKMVESKVPFSFVGGE